MQALGGWRDTNEKDHEVDIRRLIRSWLPDSNREILYGGIIETASFSERAWTTIASVNTNAKWGLMVC